MSIAPLAILMITCTAAPVDAAPAFAAVRAVEVSVWAVEATKEGREEKHFESGLAPIRKIVERLPYDTYRKVCAASRVAPFGEKTPMPIGTAFTLFVSPHSVENDGRLRMNLVVQLAPKKKGAKPIKALETTVLLVPGKKIKLRGFKRGNAELVIVFAAQEIKSKTDRQRPPAKPAE